MTSASLRVLIISDMEGVARICRWDQVNAGKPGYEEGRRLYTEEINATVRGAFAGGATEVVVMDCHGAGGDRSFNSLIPDALDARCEFVVQTRWTEYTAMLEEGCDAALFVGQHARAGAERGVLSHTVSSTSWYELRFNDVAVGEVGINAALCGTWGCPVALVTGDDVVCREAVELLGDVPTLAVKTGLGRFSARHLSPATACERLEQAASEALVNAPDAPVYDPGAPCTIAVELATPDHADRYRNRAGVTLTGPRSVESRAGSWWDAWRALYL
jgi:D-amino peptidase